MLDATINSLRVFDNNNWNISIDDVPGLGDALRVLAAELGRWVQQVLASAAWLADQLAAVNSALGGLGALPGALDGGVHAAPVPPPLPAAPPDDAVQGVVDAVQALNGKLHAMASWIEAPVQGLDAMVDALHTAYQNVGTFLHALF
ncbi:hypothetical protein [Bordetella genomosp. 13]|uniref:hypothetical protein n=1 Tax=Bordetella genomosp. 13 TaxID=463040 RepID=UPI0011A858F3|nr:hypothetical protein [Bordetella genomosp. 13]